MIRTLAFLLGCCAAVPVWAATADTYRVASYNLENYLLGPVGTRAGKAPEARAKIRESLRKLNADVVALQEVGGEAALLELRDSLRREGLSYPHWELVHGWDTNIQVAVLSRFVFVARRPHTNESFLLFGRRFRVSRGFAEVDVQVNSRYRFTLITAHLKSRRQVPDADEAEMREQEALLVRERVDTLLRGNPNLNLMVLGDLNDVKDSRSTRVLIGRYRNSLIDTRPAEQNGDGGSGAGAWGEPRRITWTHFYSKEDTYSRIDYILLSRGLAREWIPAESYVLALPDWGIGSDHRPVTAAFTAQDR